MGTISFLLPSGLTPEASRELERACMAGGPDNMPWPTEVRVDPQRLTMRRSVDESGYLVIPWAVDGAGRIMGTSATLMERPLPYPLEIELARGKVNQVRCQTADWQAGGLQVPAQVAQQVRDASAAFGKAITLAPSELSGERARNALSLAYQAADQLVRLYGEQMLQVRHQRQPRLDTVLGCRLGCGVPKGQPADTLRATFNTVCLPLPWSEIEPVEAGTYRWEAADALLDWAIENWAIASAATENSAMASPAAPVPGLSITAGPLLDFSSARLPGWLWLYERDLTTLANFMCGYVQTAVRRYRGRIRRWQLTAASNCASLLSLDEDELLWLTVRLVEAARQVDPALELVVGIAQPWGEYMVSEDRIHSPFIFADTLIRAGLNLAALDVELVMGVSPRGSYCRDLLETSRLLDLYALLGVPLRVTLGYPSSTGPDPDADPDYRVAAGHWREGVNPRSQADWATSFTSLAICKPGVQGVYWTHFSDAEPHQFPHCGLVDARGVPKPALEELRALREAHLH
jgi:hypothetical protein